MNRTLVLGLSAVMAVSTLLLIALVGFLAGRLMGAEAPAAFAVAPPPAPAPAAEDIIDIGGIFRTFGVKACLILGSWPGFRGPDRTNVSVEDLRLADRWSDCGPKVLWTADLGEGCGGAAVHHGRVYVSDYDRAAREESLRCFSLDDGREIWRRSHRISIPNYHGVSRTVPAVNDRYVVSIGPKCHVLCVEVATGARRWGLDLAQEFGTEVPLWYTGQCALLEGETVILAPAGRTALLVGVDAASGKVIWKTPNPEGWRMSHSSIMPMRVNGVRMYVYGAEGGKIAAVSAEPANAGELLWTWSGLEKQVFVPSPVSLGEGRVFLTSLYGAGSAVIDASSLDSNRAAKTISLFPVGRSLACDLHTPVYYEGLLFGVQSGDAGTTRNQFVCMNPSAGGAIVWKSGAERRFSPFGPFLMADGKFILLDAEGILTLVKASRTKYEELARFKLSDWRESRAPMAIAGGRLLLRDERRLVCLDLRE